MSPVAKKKSKNEKSIRAGDKWIKVRPYEDRSVEIEWPTFDVVIFTRDDLRDRIEWVEHPLLAGTWLELVDSENHGFWCSLRDGRLFAGDEPTEQRSCKWSELRAALQPFLSTDNTERTG